MVEMTPYDLTKGRITFSFRPSSVVSEPEKVCVLSAILTEASPVYTHRYFKLNLLEINMYKNIGLVG